jgi:hypothetical protein
MDDALPAQRTTMRTVQNRQKHLPKRKQKEKQETK